MGVKSAAGASWKPQPEARASVASGGGGAACPSAPPLCHRPPPSPVPPRPQMRAFGYRDANQVLLLAVVLAAAAAHAAPCAGSYFALPLARLVAPSAERSLCTAAALKPDPAPPCDVQQEEL